MKLKDLHSGLLRKKIEIQSVTKVSDGGGGWTHTWATDAIVYSAWESLGSGERLHAMQLESTISYKVYIRYRSGVTAINRIYCGGFSYQIRSVVDLEQKHRWMELLVEEGVAT